MKLLVGVLLSCSLLFAMVDINHADSKELTSLKGIGKSKAEKIIEYRKSNGCFKSINELVNVKGIGKGIVTKNESQMKITSCK